jgi:hypothetical protein
MYRENAPPPPPDPTEAARQAVKNSAMIQMALAGVHLFTLLSTSLTFAFYKLPAGLTVDPEVMHDVRVYAFLGGLGYVVVFAGWGFLNAWGLGKRSKIARWSSIGYAAATLMTCLAAPIGGFLLYLLLRRDVKSYFG